MQGRWGRKKELLQLQAKDMGNVQIECGEIWNISNVAE
jgi:hypothetical protein